MEPLKDAMSEPPALGHFSRRLMCVLHPRDDPIRCVESGARGYRGNFHINKCSLAAGMGGRGGAGRDAAVHAFTSSV